MHTHTSATTGQSTSPCLQCLYQPEGGILAPERCIEAHVAVAQQHGAQVHTQEKVLHWRVDQLSGEVHVTTDRGHYTAGSLVLTAGAWMSDMLPLQVGPPAACLPCMAGHKNLPRML